MHNNEAKPLLKIFVRINTIFMSKYALTIAFRLSKIEISQKLAKKGDFRNFLDPFFGFYTKNSPRNSWSPHFMITYWNQKSRNTGTSVLIFSAVSLKMWWQLIYLFWWVVLSTLPLLNWICQSCEIESVTKHICMCLHEEAALE